jgi:DHA1 family bicyclomycin/chloramphenicol resistance-like MFS transporter
VLYVVASLLCAAAPSLGALASLRFVQGLGGCAGLVIARAIVRDGFDGPELTRSFSIIASVSMVAPLLAPSAGALVLRAASWRVLFLVIAVFGAACLVAALRLPETHPRDRRTEQGLLASLRGYGRLLGNRAFVLPASIAALGSGTLLAYISSSSVVVMTTYGAGPGAFALVFALLALCFIAGIRLNLVLLRHRAVHQLLRLYVAVEAAALVVLLALLEVRAPLWAVLAALAVVKACLGGVFPNATAESMQPFKRTAGSASALLGTLQFAVGGVVVGVLAAIALAPGVEMAGSMLILATLSLVLVALPPRPSGDEPVGPDEVDAVDLVEGSGSAG